jgi:hypothetical protein
MKNDDFSFTQWNLFGRKMVYFVLRYQHLRQLFRENIYKIIALGPVIFCAVASSTSSAVCRREKKDSFLRNDLTDAVWPEMFEKDRPKCSKKIAQNVRKRSPKMFETDRPKYSKKIAQNVRNRSPKMLEKDRPKCSKKIAQNVRKSSPNFMSCLG